MRCAAALAALAGCGAPPAPADAALGASYPHAARIKPLTAHEQAHFGARVALSADGRSLAVGAPREDSGQTGVSSDGNDHSTPDAGAVYFYTLTVAGWELQTYIKPAVAGEGDQFGVSVGLSALGDTLVVGAPGEGSLATGVNGDAYNNSASGAGAAYVFKRHGVTWMQQAYLKASNTAGGDSFGLAVAVATDGNTVAVGAPDAAGHVGAVYTFSTDGELWMQSALVQPASDTAFGSAIALSADGTTLAIGAHDAVELLRRDTPTWAAVQRLAGTAFGTRLALSGLGTTLVVGAPRDSGTGTGTATVFGLDGTIWSQRAQLASPHAGTADRFGAAIAVSGDGKVVAVSDPTDDTATTDAGAAFVFAATGDFWLPVASIVEPFPTAGDQLGAALALSSSGTVLAVGVALDSESAAASGAVYVYR